MVNGTYKITLQSTKYRRKVENFNKAYIEIN